MNRLACVSYDPIQPIISFPVLRIRFNRLIKEGQTNMDVSGVGSASGATPARAVAPITNVPQPTSASPVLAPQDELEISSAGKMLDRLSESPEIRAQRLAQIQEAIENGAYDTDEKLEAALSKMFDSLGLDLDE
ncbi:MULTISPECIES: flagellar biosynthesis anti-sigma factor FlgM [unclassified Schlesneria]|uniref:flagellar biosynthesis anti-sigma factor FlgM n=1 Tax=Schlesneria TaxID=656899 RepID=UPI00359FE773